MKDAAAIVLGIAAALSVLGGWWALADHFDADDELFERFFWPYDLLARLNSHFLIGVLVLPAMCLQVLTVCLFGAVVFGSAGGAGILVASVVLAL